MMHGMCLKFNLRLLQFLIFLLFSTILSNYWTLSNNERGRLLKIKTPYGRLATIPGAGTRRKMMYFIYRQGTGNVYVTIYICIYIYIYIYIERERERAVLVRLQQIICSARKIGRRPIVSKSKEIVFINDRRLS